MIFLKKTYSKSFILSCILISILLIFSIRSCKDNNEDKINSSISLELYNKKVQDFKVKIGKNNEKIAIQKQLIIKKDREIEKILAENTMFKKVQTQVKIDFDNKVKDIVANYTKEKEYITIYKDIDSSGDKEAIGIKYGTKFNVKEDSSWYQLSGEVSEMGIKIDSMMFRNDLTISFGQEKGGWFKKQNPSISIINKNPYTEYNTISNIHLENESKLINKPWFSFIIGIVGGAATTTVLFLSNK